MADEETPERRLRTAFADLGSADLNDLVSRCEAEDLTTVASFLDIRVDVRRVRGGIERLVRTRWLKLTPPARQAVARILTLPVIFGCAELLGPDRSDHPSVEDLGDVLDELLNEFSVAQVRFAFTFGINHELPAAQELALCLENDERLRAAPPAPSEPMPASAHPVSTTAATGANAPADSDVEEPDGAPEDDETLFTSLDRMLITTAVATANGQLAAPSEDELVELTDELLSLNASRKHSYFHVGFVAALLDRPISIPAAGLNEERRLWRTFGQLSGLVRRGEADAVAKAALDDMETTCELVADAAMGQSLTSPLITAVLPDDPVFAARLIEARQERFLHGSSTLWLVYDAGRRLLLDGRQSDAEHLFMALLPWAPAMSRSDDATARIVRRIASCHRATGALGVALGWLDRLGEVDASDGALAALETERGLIAAGIGRLTDIQFPRDDERRIALMESLDKGRQHFEDGFDLDPTRPHAAYCLGVLALCEDRTGDAARLLDAAESGMRGDSLFEESGLRPDVTFHRAAAMLADGEIGREDAAFEAMNEALSSGCRPSPKLVVEAAIALAEAGAPSLSRFVSRSLDLKMKPAPLVPLVCESAGRGNQSAIDLVRRMGGLGRLNHEHRMECLLAAFEGLSVLADSDAESVVDAVEELLVEAGSDDLDEIWLVALRDNDQLRSLISAPTAELMRSDICRRLGRTEEAVGIVGGLARRSANGALDGYDAEDLLVRLEELGASEQDLADCRAAVGSTAEVPAVPAAELPESVTVLFVGGDERQKQHDTEIAAGFTDRYDSMVNIEFFHPGWSSNWNKWATRVEGRYESADAVVLMPYVRTNLGRRIRRTAGEAGLPWIACTGHSRNAMEQAIERAVAVTVSRKHVS